MELERLQSLFSKYNIRNHDATSYSMDIFENTYVILKNIGFEKLDQMIDVYNSIDYITEFLLLNGFENSCSSFFANLNFRIFICLDPHVYFADGKSYNSQDLITYLREKLDLESSNKLINK